MYLLFDIGGTKMRAAVSEDGVSLGEVKSVNTPAEFDDAVGFFADFKNYSFETVAGGVPGVLNKEKSLLMRAPNLQKWVGVSIKDKLEEIFGTSVVLENDAALAGLGEAFYGAGRDENIIAYLTISTGVGGARIVNKKIDISSWGFEPGKHIIDADVTYWPECVNFNPKNIPPGSVESCISGAALNFRYGKPPSDIKDLNVWRQVETMVVVALYNTISYWSPEVIVLGGAIVLENAVSFEQIEEGLNKMVGIFPELPKLRKAGLGDTSALHGALALITHD